MIRVGVHEAKTRLSELLKLVLGGEVVVISKSGTSIARLIPESRPPSKRKANLDFGKIKMAADFSAPLDEKTLKLFEGN